MVQIRQATFDDFDVLSALREERTVLLGQSDTRLLTSMQQGEAWRHFINMALDSPDYQVFLAYVDAGVVGYLIGRLQGNVAIIIDVALHAHQYHGGVGRQLFREFRQSLMHTTIRRLMVQLPRFYAVEQAFWRSLGAQTIHDEDKNLWEIPVGMMLMRLPFDKH